MKLMAPDYYGLFRCIADRCRHSCCIGWEIDIDPDTREKYRHIPGAFGKRLNEGIEDTPEGAHFHLLQDERCPMLNKNGLCDLITTIGELNLCKICADHPRFRNFFSERTEVGLGLCCEAAAALILQSMEPVQFVALEEAQEQLTDDEEDLLALRSHLIAIMQNRTIPLEQRLDLVLEAIRFPLPPLDWQKIFSSLERLDHAWDTVIAPLTGKDLSLPCPTLDALLIPLEQFAVYMLWRHMPAALEDGDVQGHAAFCVLSVKVLAALCTETPTLEHCIEAARMYSSEIEYSQENIVALLDALWSE